jgi:HEAT repeat protein
VAAVWGLARMRDPRAIQLLRRVPRTATPAMRALALLGLGMARDKASIASIAEVARSSDAGNVSRAAAAYALGDLGAEGQVPVLLELAEDGDELPRRMAIVALSHMAALAGQSSPKDPPWADDAVQAMANAVFAGRADMLRAKPSESLARTAVASLALMAERRPGLRPAWSAREALPVPEGPLDVDAILAALAPGESTDAGRSAALVRYAEPLRRAALAALRTSGERAQSVLAALGTGEGELLPFVTRAADGPTDPAHEKARDIARSLEPNVVPLARHPDPAVRSKAIALLTRSSSDDATNAVAMALEDSDEAVQRIALAAVGGAGAAGAHPPASARTVTLVGKILAGHPSWPMRVLAAQALGRLGAAGAAAEAGRGLSEAAVSDGYALVREAALGAFAAFDTAGARGLAARMATSDPEPRVREAAAALAK